MEESASAACMVAESAVVKTNAKEVEYASKEVLEATLEMYKQSDVNVEKAVVEEEEEEGVAKDEKAVMEEQEEEEGGVAKYDKAVMEGLELEEQNEGMESEEEINEGLESEEEKTVEEKKAELEEEDGEGLKVEDEKVELE